MRFPSFARGVFLSLALVPTAFGLLAALPADARACGGCFHGETPPPKPGDPPEQPSVVTDHRMVLALATGVTTLWDQVEYAGAPEEFAWVLPIRGTVVVGLGSDKFIDALDQLTAPEIDSPRPPACPRSSPRVGCGGGGTTGCSSSAAGDGTDDFGVGYQEDSGIFVTDRSAVGPYETVQVHGDTEDAIVGWLRAHKYVVPPEIEPILRRYVDEGFDFVAVRLRPGKGVQAMQPIRVSFRGAYPTLPLRMVAAGVGASVGIKLFVIGDGRWTTSNFPAFSVDPAQLTWDFAAQRSNYVTIRDRMAQDYFGRAFALESSLDLASASFPYIPPPPPEPLIDAGHDAAPLFDALPDGPLDAVADADADADTDGEPDALDVLDADRDGALDAEPDAEADADTSADAGLDGGSADTDPGIDAFDTAPDAAHDTHPPPTYDGGPPPSVDPFATDVAIAFGSRTTRRVTRLRADLPARFLDDDLQLEADPHQNVVDRKLQVQSYVNGPTCPSTAANAQNGGREGCNVATDSDGGELPTMLGGLGLACAGAVLRRVRRTRR